MRDSVLELQLDGLPGPTHHFGGLSYGNLASMNHAGWKSRPRRAALQGLAKMRQVLDLGLKQALLPPLERPDVRFLRAVGFAGTDSALLHKAAVADPYLLSLSMSSAFMWAANLATVIPSIDSGDRRCHMVVANLRSTPHRSLEAQARAEMLRQLFTDPNLVTVHDPLPSAPSLSDEGAANHSRLATRQSDPGSHLFVYGRTHDTPAKYLPRKFPPRQTYEASRSVARLGHLRLARALFVQQHSWAIDAGAFHNDVVMVGDGERVLLHEYSWRKQNAVLAQLGRRLPALQVHEVKARDLSLAGAVQSYLFNSQLLRSHQSRVLLAPMQSSSGRAAKVVQRLLDEGFVDRVLYQELDESMAGGGGPACLRLRIPLTEPALASLNQSVLLNDEKIGRLEAWVKRHYREDLTQKDLADPNLLVEARQALDELTQMLKLGFLYAFQRGGHDLAPITASRP